jgi:enoyl-CoA hydratase/carnithine racemase
MAMQQEDDSRPACGSTVESAPALLAIDGTIATITLNRPERFNALDLDIVTTLARLGREVAAHDDVRVLILKGNGPAFCAGGDINVFAANIDNLAPVVRELLTRYHAFLRTLVEMPKLVLTSVHGAAAGAGLSLAFMGDLCIAGDDARFTPAYAKLGVSPDGGGTIGVLKSVGMRRAMQIFLAEESFSARDAEAWGLVNKVVSTSALADETLAFAKRLARNEPAAIAGTKTLLRQSPHMPLAMQLEAEMDTLIGCMAQEAFRNAVRRFVDR